MRLTGVTILAGLIMSQPSAAFERFAHLQPTRGTQPLPALQSEVDARPENQVAKLRQERFDKRIDRSSKKVVASLCDRCGVAHSARLRAIRQLKFDANEASLVSADTIYVAGKTFDPAQAGGE